MKYENHFWERISSEADLPDEVFPGQSLVEVVGDRRVLIENHRGVKEYGTEKICVKVKHGTILICGSNLTLRCMTRSQLVISGCIQSILINRG